MVNNSETMGFLKSGWHKTEIITGTNGNQTIYQGKSRTEDGDESAAIWCIKKTTVTKNGSVQTVVEKFADGNFDFDNVWADRAALTYKYY